MPVDRINETTLAYDVAGEGPPLLMIHGSWGERGTWGFVVPGLAESFRVVTYDRRGHGESTSDPVAGTVHDDVADAAGLIETLGLAPARVVAGSYGACIALRLATARPDLVERLVCHEPPMLGLLEGAEQTRPIAQEEWRKLGEVRARLERGDHEEGARFFAENVALGPGMWEKLPQPLREMFVRHAPTFLGELSDADALRCDLDALKQLGAPVHLTQGDQSPPIFAPVIDLLANVLPNVRRHTFAGAGHVPHVTHAEEYVRVVREFLSGEAG